MTEQTPNLKELIRRLEKRNQKRQAANAVIAGTAVLALVAFLSPVFAHKKAEPVAEAPAAALPEGPDAYAGVALEGKAAIVYDLATGEVLYQKNARSQLPLASLTKLLTVYAAAGTLSPEDIVSISDTALASEGESGLSSGETFAFEDLARLTLVSSSNDGAAAIAEAASAHMATSGKNLLASAAAAAGLSQTYALNGTGLDESSAVSGGYGSAYDVATLSGELLKKAPDIARATVEPSITVQSKTGAVHTLPNTNLDVVHISNLLLSKTGYTDLAGGNLSVVYDAGIGHPVAVVVLGSSRDGRFTDVEKLIARTEAHFAGVAP